MNCKEFSNAIPDLLMSHGARPGLDAVAHMKVCPPCKEEFLGFQATFALLDDWRTPDVTPYFDQKLAVRLREEQAAPGMGLLERLRTRLLLNTGSNFRPAMAATLAFALLFGVGGGGLAGVRAYHEEHPPQASATIEDLQILDRNQQAFEQLDQLEGLQADSDRDTPADREVQPLSSSNGPNG